MQIRKINRLNGCYNYGYQYSIGVNNMKKTVFLFLFLMVCGLLLTGCGGQAGSTEPAAVSDTTDEIITDAPGHWDSVDVDGAAMTALIRTEFAYEFDMENESGDVVEDAVYARNQAVEELLNIDLKFVKTDGNWPNREIFRAAIQSSVLANDGAYDLCFGALNQLMPYVADGYFLNLLELDHLDFTQDWWFRGFTDNMTVNGRLYGAVGDAAKTMLENMCVVLFNKQIAEDYHTGDLYAVVRDGDWIYDRFIELSRGVSTDLDGNGTWNADDLYGYLTTGIMYRACCASFELPVTEPGEDGFPKLVMGSERHVRAFDKVSSAMNGSDPVYVSQGNTDQTAQEMRTMFSENKALFMWQTLASSQILRGMEMDFGILPYPKYDEVQEDYHTQALETHTVLTVPVSAGDADRSAALLEALSEKSIDTVTPAYFESALKSKYTRDEESAEMLDLIRAGILFNFGFVNSVAMQQVGAIFGQMTNGSYNYASSYASQEAVYTALLDELLEYYR